MRIPLAVFAWLSALLPAQQVALPHGTGNLTPAAGWTALGAAELALDERPNDPRAEPARTLLSMVVGDLKQRGRTAEHVLLHAPGAAEGQLRLVNCYSAEGRATVAELLSERAVGQIRDAVQQALSTDGVETEYLGHERTDVFAIGGLLMHFAQSTGDHRFLLDYFVTPAGDRLQYFEASRSAGDDGAPATVAALLRTFDGAREAHDGTLKNMILGGALGAVAGVATALLRRRRLQRQAAGSARDAS